LNSTNTVCETIHTTFTIERDYPVSPARVFHAFADHDSKRRWLVEGDGFRIDEYTSEFRVGGREFSRFRYGDGPEIQNETSYHDIVPDRRIVFVYTMTVGGRRMSTSLTTVALAPTPDGTRLTFTEQAAFYDGIDDPAGREVGCRGLLEELAKELAATR
jgi:uncharacterized protein YndB with AHSA1/START domain